MHRHGYKGPKLQRERDQRRALMKGLATSLIRDESIETTLPKAKAVVPYIEKLITKAKKGGAHQERLIRTKVSTDEAVSKLVEVVVPASQSRNSGHVRIEKVGYRRGDNAPMATVSFVDNLEAKEEKPTKAKATKKVAPKAPAKEAKKAVKKPAAKKAESKDDK